MFTNTRGRGGIMARPARTIMTGMEIFVFISCGDQTKTFKVEARGCKSIKAYHLFAISNLNVNNTDVEG